MNVKAGHPGIAYNDYLKRNQHSGRSNWSAHPEKTSKQWRGKLQERMQELRMQRGHNSESTQECRGVNFNKSSVNSYKKRQSNFWIVNVKAGQCWDCLQRLPQEESALGPFQLSRKQEKTSKQRRGKLQARMQEFRMQKGHNTESTHAWACNKYICTQNGSNTTERLV